LGTLYNCTLTGNSADLGGGAAFSILYNCTLTGNSAGEGGGAAGGVLYNCKLSRNSAQTGGGGTGFSCTLYNCTLTGNSAGWGGGAFDSTLYNCIAYFNSPADGSEGFGCACFHSCSTGLLPGEGNITNEPAFLDLAAGDVRLRSGSPCINSGYNGYSSGSTDLDGHPRIIGGTVDIGAYEYQTPGSLLSYAWLQAYGLPMDGSADHSDEDSDHFDNWQEWRAGTDPKSARSLLLLSTPVPGPSGVAVSWQSVSERIYFLDRSTNLGAGPVFLPWRSNIVGQAGTTTLTDADAGVGPVLFLYRVGVQE
jgi:hypothetical protein